MKQDIFNNSSQYSIEFWESAYTYAIEKVRDNISNFSDGYPAPSSNNNVYPKIANIEWTSSFWNGMLWLSYLHTRDEVFRHAGEATLEDYATRLQKRIETNTHDLGFLYILSAKAEYLVTHNESAKITALLAADLLMERYHPKAGIIQAWRDLEDPNQRGRIIIDCLMNIPLLFWATEETKNPRYQEAALRHLARTRETIIRPDATTYHTYYFDTETGNPLRGVTAQGYSDDSCWARGQAWGIYGLTLAYTYTLDPACLVDAKRLAEYFLSHLPSDDVCYWDLIFTDGDEERDSSACAIASCGLMLLASLLPEDDIDAVRYQNKALDMLASLSKSYTTQDNPESNGILMHAVYGKPNNAGVDECVVWGDYFYMEALGTVLGSATRFW
ncbi:glycoside hydrolase family 88 protein [uncultured Sphaerochaeta sp.]|uniref:glycoside hydrolase family 88 protein n=1 Tax=uncultured Sphaerochaeta sp. TaxID=886478 RepID=UPI002A0A91E3|nr:glycoside hydrolase family 88 protein [uncultured Sphaerochaeta sp.]